MQSRGVRVRFLGRREGVDGDLLRRIDAAEAADPAEPAMTHVHRLQLRRAATRSSTPLARWRRRSPRRPPAVRPAAPDSRSRELVTEDALRACLYAPEMHDPELLIRTSGEERISNFLLWQLAYTELYFTDKLWPDFGADDLDEALAVVRHAGATVRRPMSASPAQTSAGVGTGRRRARHARHRRRGARAAGARRHDPRRPGRSSSSPWRVA